MSDRARRPFPLSRGAPFPSPAAGRPHSPRPAPRAFPELRHLFSGGPPLPRAMLSSCPQGRGQGSGVTPSPLQPPTSRLSSLLLRLSFLHVHSFGSCNSTSPMPFRRFYSTFLAINRADSTRIALTVKFHLVLSFFLPENGTSQIHRISYENASILGSFAEVPSRKVFSSSLSRIVAKFGNWQLYFIFIQMSIKQWILCGAGY